MLPFLGSFFQGILVRDLLARKKERGAMLAWWW